MPHLVPKPNPPLRHLPLVDLLVDTKIELLQLALRSGLKVFTAVLEEDRSAIRGTRMNRIARASRAGTTRTEVVLGRRTVTVQRPRVRTAAGEVSAEDRLAGCAGPTHGGVQGADEQQVPWIEFRKAERKDKVVQRYWDRFRKPRGVVLIGVAQERASAWSATKQQRGRFVHFQYFRKSVYPNQYYVYVLDPEWGPAFIKICGYAPYAIKICLNGH